MLRFVVLAVAVAAAAAEADPVVDKPQLKVPLCPPIFQLTTRRIQPTFKTCLTFCPPLPQSHLQDLHAWCLNEDIPRFQATLLDLLDPLHVNVEDADLALVGHLGHAGPAGAVHVAPEYCMLQEGSLLNQGLHVSPCSKVIVLTRLFQG